MAQELKVYRDPKEGPCWREFYEKSEVDTVLAEKDAENRRLKELMPKYKQFIEDEDFKKKLVDEYDGYVYEWLGHKYIATPYINIFIKGILRALWLARAERAKDRATTCNDFAYLGDTERDINMTLARTWMKCRILKSSEWSKVWNNVERKCRAKAEQYK